MIPSFTKWLLLRKKRPTPGRMGDEEARAIMSRTHEKPSREGPDPDELDALWHADPDTGITDQMRKAANSRNPKAHASPEELEDLWKKLGPE